MKAGIFFTGTGPILILTTYDSFTDPGFLAKTEAKGIKKFVAREVPVDAVKQKYGAHYEVVMGDLSQKDDLRVMDYNGHHVFYNFTFAEMGAPVYHEP
jgi:hypothetical protein